MTVFMEGVEGGRKGTAPDGSPQLYTPHISLSRADRPDRPYLRFQAAVAVGVEIQLIELRGLFRSRGALMHSKSGERNESGEKL